MKRSILLADCDKTEIESLIKAIKDDGKEIDCLSVISNGPRSSRFSNFGRYIRYFSTPLYMFRRRKQYDYIIGWQQFYAIIYGFWCSVFHVKKTNKVIVLNYTYKDKKGLIGTLYKQFMKSCACSKYIDYLHVLSGSYAKMLSKELGIPKEKFIVFPFGIDDLKEKTVSSDYTKRVPRTKYALAIGRSNRDYDYLISVWEKIDMNLVIISDEYKRAKLPNNVLLVNDVSGDEQYPWIANCDFLIIPIDDIRICSGDTVLLTAMSYGKTIFVTSPSTLAEMYVVDGKDAIYIDKDIDNTRNIINNYLNHIEENNIGANARKTFLEKYSRYIMGSNISKLIV